MDTDSTFQERQNIFDLHVSIVYEYIYYMYIYKISLRNILTFVLFLNTTLTCGRHRSSSDNTCIAFWKTSSTSFFSSAEKDANYSKLVKHNETGEIVKMFFLEKPIQFNLGHYEINDFKTFLALKKNG